MYQVKTFAGRIRTSIFNISITSDFLNLEMATHSSVLAWRIPGTGKPGGLLWGHKELDMTEQIST